jgi:hypothetical protein
MIEALKKKTVIEETRFTIIQAIHNKPIINFVLNVEKLKEFSLKSGTRHSCL